MRPLLEKLEDRILLTAEPTVTIDGPATVELGAQNVNYTLTFDNTSGDATPGDPNDGDVGYAPFINVVLPSTGADGDDGVTFDSASFLTTAVTTTVQTFDSSGEAVHPLAVDALGDPLVINGTPGDTLVVIELPYGSFSPNQVPVDVDLVLDFSNLADLSEVPQIQATGGFALGNDPLDNPTAPDPTILGATDTLDVTQELLFLTKENDGPESESATGPNFSRIWTINVDAADGQTLNNVVVTDLVPINIHYLGNLTVAGATSTIDDQPAVNAVVAPGDQDIQITIPTLVGGNPATISFDYFIPEFDGNGAPVLNPTSGNDSIAVNDVAATADWLPIDPRDRPGGNPVSVASDVTAQDDILELKSIAVQKSLALTDDQNVAGISPGDTLTYTLNVQISDFFTVGDIVLTDVLGDGLDFVPGSVLFSVNETDGDTIATTAFDAGALSATLNSATGETTLVFDLSGAMLAEGAADGILVGDLVNGVQANGTIATITYEAVIEDTFDNPIGDSEVSQGDTLSNAVTVAATVRDNAASGTTTDTETDTSAASVTIPFGEVQQKTIDFINGLAPSPGQIISAGDVITFSLIYQAPEGSYEELVLDDFLPLPVFDSTTVTSFIPGPGGGAPPPSGSAAFGAATSADYFAQGGTAPSLSTNGTSNSVSFDFDTFSIDPRASITLEVLFSITVEDAIFADGLLLTNQVSASEDNTSTSPSVTTTITQFTYGQPELEITKGVIASDQGTFTAGTGPVSFNAPGTTSQRWPGGDAINSDGLDTTPVDADLDGVDAGDLVSFAIIVENTGSSPDGVFNVQIQDTLPAGFEIPLGGLNLDVRNGAGTALAFTDLGGGLFGSGIELDDGAGTGTLSSFDATSGTNIVIVTYDLRVSDTTGPQESIENTASVDNFAAFETGINRVPAGGLEDDATVDTLDPTVDKIITSTSINGDTSNQVLIGEVVTYEITISLTEGLTEDVTFIDRTRFTGQDPDPGALEILDAEILSIGGNLTLQNSFSVGGSPSTPPFDNDGDTIDDLLEYDFGDITNAPDGVADANDEIVIEVTALIRDVPATEGGDLLTNQARVEYEGTAVQENENVRVTESNITIDKTVTPDTVDAGDEVTYQVEITNNPLIVDGNDRSAAAYDFVVTDLLSDPDLTLVAGSVVLSGSGSGGALINTGNTPGDATIEVVLDELATGDPLIIEYRATVANTVALSDILANTATTTYDSLPTDNDPNERDYSIDDDAQVQIVEPLLTKLVDSTNLTETSGSNLAIGEEVVFRIETTIPEGTAPIVITDTLPTTPGVLTFVSGTVIDVGTDLTGAAIGNGDTVGLTGGDVVFNFGTITNLPDGDNLDESIVVEVRALVEDLTANADGDLLTNNVVLSFGPDPDDTVSASTDVSIVEPSIQLDKTAPAGPVDSGDVVTFSVTVDNTGTSPAFDLVLADLLTDSGLALVSSSVSPSDGTAVVTETGDGFRLTLPVLDAGDSLTVTYQATVQDAALFNSSLTNTATVERFDTNPSDDPVDPARETVFDPNNPDPDLTDTETIPTVGVTLEKATSVAATDQSETGDVQFDPAVVDLSVGEEVTYTLTIGVPEGTSNLLLTDAIPTGLIAIGATAVSLDAGVTSANLAAGDDETSASITISGTGDQVVFDFGTIISTGVDDPAGAGDLRQIVVQVTSVVADVAAATAGAQLTNTATLQAFDPNSPTTELTDPGNPTQASETVEVVEPSIQLDKTAPAGPVDSGDVVTFSVTVDNTGTSPAFDLVLADLLTDSGLALVSSSVSPSDGTAVVTETGDGFRLTLPVLDAGDSLTVTYQATVQDAALFNSSLTNTATVERFDTNPSDDPVDPARETVFDPNNPDPDLTDTETIPTVGVTLEKATSVAATDQSETGDVQFDPAVVDLSVGEEVTYTLTIGVPEGTSNLLLTDAIPTGLIAIGATAVSLDAGVTSANLAAGDDETSASITISGTGDQVVFDFGTIISTGVDDPAGAGDLRQIVVQVTSVVADVAAATAGAQLTNTATLQAFDPNSPTTELTDPGNPTQASETVEVVEPSIQLDKTAPAGPVDSGDVVTFSVTVDNTGTSPAFDLVLADLLTDSGLALVSSSVSPSDGTAVVTETGDGFRLTLPVLDAGDSLTVTYQATVQDAALFNSSLTNTATVERFDTNPSDDPVDPARETVFDPNNPDPDLTDTETIPTVGVTLEKATSVAATDQSETGDVQFDPAVVDLSVGEEVTYTLTIGVPEGTSNLLLTDAIPTGLIAIGATAVSLDAGVTSANLAAGDDETSASITISGTGDQVVFDFGTIISTGVDDPAGAGDLRQIVVQVTSVVADVAAATAGAQLTNTATLQAFDPNSPTTELTDPGNPTQASETVEVVEPVLVIDKAAPVAVAQGDTVSYQVTVTHDPSSTGPAFNLVLADDLAEPFLLFDSGSASVAGVAGAVLNEVGTGFTISIPVLEIGQTAIITYTATLAAGAPDAGSFPNTATLDFDSDPGPGGRAQNGSDDAFVVTTPSIAKILDSSTFAETADPELGLGEAATFRLEISLPEALNEGLLVSDTLPTGMTPFAGRVISVGGQLSAAGTVPNLNFPLINIAGQVISFNFDDVDNAPDSTLDAGDLIVVEIDALLDADAAENLDGESLANFAEVSSTLGGTLLENDASTTVSVVVPDVALTKSSSPTGDVDAGDVIDFTLEVQNTGTGPAYDLRIEDLMQDAGLSLVAGSVTSSDGSTAVDVVNGDGTLGFTLDAPVLDAGGTLTITYRAVVTDAAEFNGSVGNTAQVASFDTNPLEPGDPGFEGEAITTADPNDPNDPLIDGVKLTTIDVTLDKATTVTDTSQTETGDEQFDPALVDLSIGETVTYTLTFGVPEGNGILRLTDVIPAGLTATGATVQSFDAGITSANLTPGDDETSASITISGAGDQVVFDFGTVTSTGVDDPAGAGDLRQIVVQVTNVVADVAVATAGTQLTNKATLQVFDPADPTTELTDPNNPTDASETVEVVEPILALDKSTTETGPVDAGDQIPYQITIQNSGTGPAFDNLIEDLLQDAGLSLVSGSVISSDGTTATEVANGDGTLGFTLIAPVLDAGATLTITYDAVVTNGFSFGVDVENTARVVSFDTSPLEPGDPNFVTERTVTSDPIDPNDPLIDEEAIQTGTPDFEKSVFTTSVTETGDGFFDPVAPDLAIGEVVVYRFEIDLPEGASDLTITDQLPLDGAFSFLGVFVTGTATISGPQVLTPTTSFTDSNADTFADQLVIDLGAVTNAADNVLDANDTLIIDALIRIDDNLRNAEGDSFTNVATLDFGSGTVNDDAVIGVVEPNIVLDKSVEDTDLFLGQTFDYTLVIENLATATAPAFDLVITDLIPAGIVLTGNLTLSDPTLGTVIDGDQPGDTAIEINVPILQPDQTLTITYEAEVEFTSPILEDLVNTAQVTGGSVPLVGNPPPEFPGPPGLADGPGRPISLEDSAVVVAVPTGAPERDRTPNFSVIDDELFFPVVLIDPIYSGATEYGAGLSIELFDELGGFVSSRYVLADAAGQWIASFPLVQTGIDQDRGFDQFFEAGSIFKDPTGTLPDTNNSQFGLSPDERIVRIGTLLTDDEYRLRVEDTAGVNADQQGKTFNTRLFYAPAMNHDLFMEPESIRIDKVFEGTAELTIQRLFDASVNPLASGLNRFNAEFLTASATPGGTR